MEATFTQTKTNFDTYWTRVLNEREPLYIHKQGYEDVVLIPAIELSSLTETARSIFIISLAMPFF